MIEPGIFAGTLRHRRFTPVEHSFVYRTFMVLLDIDRIADLMRVSRLTGYNTCNWATFHDCDHLGDPAQPMRARLAADAARHGIELPAGPIFLLTNLRYLGYCFNPVSFYYLFDRVGGLRLVVAEVNNTFGGSHHYWLHAEGRAATFRSAAAKSLYVSPFLPGGLDYRFAFTRPERNLVAHMKVLQEGSVMFDATLSLDRRPWTATELRRQLLRQPAMTLKVIAAIHWQALRLWLKGVPVVPRATRNGVAETDANAVMER